MRIIRSFLLFASTILSLSLLVSCELLRVAAFEIVASSPDSGLLANPADCVVSLQFSGEPNRTSTENAFSLSEDGVALAGAFVWNGKTMVFSPHLPLRENREYVLIVKADACDEHGLSLDENFELRFTTKSESVRPAFISSIPASGLVLPGEFDLVSLSFSEQLDLLSAIENLSISPSMEGYWRYGSERSVLVFEALAPWKSGTEYEIKVNANICDLAGNRIGKEERIRFTAGLDTEKPVLLRAEAVDESGVAVALLHEDDGSDGIITENALWESSWRLRLVFSEEVRISSMSGKLVSEGGPSMVMQTLGEKASKLLFGFEERPIWDIRCSIRLREGIQDTSGNPSALGSLFRLRTNGVASEPPRIIGIRMPLAPLQLEKELAHFTLTDAWTPLRLLSDTTHYLIAKPIQTFIEVYIQFAPGAELDVYRMMKDFRIEATNGTLAFMMTSVKTSGFSVSDPYPGYESFTRVEIGGKLTNDLPSGIVTFVVDAGFADSKGNLIAGAFRLPLVK